VLRVLQGPVLRLQCYYLVKDQNFQILSEEREENHMLLHSHKKNKEIHRITVNFPMSGAFI